ncbi:hypothetical protein Poli38472_006252 [Pythium oligandrum]|uniref:Uncharacterized protein n=1 Tax=Pythium oligandrum TaxID=41045 RepID=A0A8K1CSJ7_PYTOL|nr:hypothetical protein Poli38472_006252 [Pythium oligandrum]|eukprot:TMW68784.1 hypothetical protein Poli38472_006252 [Pythium oligandrum]
MAKMGDGRRWSSAAAQHRKAMGEFHRRETMKLQSNLEYRGNPMGKTERTVLVYPLASVHMQRKSHVSAFPTWGAALALLGSFLVVACGAASAYSA